MSSGMYYASMKRVYAMAKKLERSEVAMSLKDDVRWVNPKSTTDGDHYDDDMVGRCNAFLEKTKERRS